MAEIVTMPKLGFDMAEGTLVRWVVAEGEQVNKGGVLAEIETDKATVEVESTASGQIAAQFVAEGSLVPVGDPIAVIAQPGEEVEGVHQRRAAGVCLQLRDGTVRLPAPVTRVAAVAAFSAGSTELRASARAS